MANDTNRVNRNATSGTYSNPHSAEPADASAPPNPQTDSNQRLAAARNADQPVDISNLPNDQAVPNNKDPNSPEMQSLNAQAEAQRNADKEPEGTRVRLHMRTSGLTDSFMVRQVWFDAGFVLVEEMDGRKVAFPAQEVGKVEFGPANLAWD